ncbi:MAG: DUF5686 and carboxypeptidase regulatory-like domain-containing protein [Deltaproteobacteria bacterium]
MKNKPFLLLLLLNFISIFSFCQLSGIVSDETGKPLPFATIYNRNTSVGVITNEEGEYKVSLSEGENIVIFKYLGYQTVEKQIIYKGKNLKENVKLRPNDIILSEVIIRPDAEDPAYEIIRKAIASREKFKNKPENINVRLYNKLKIELLDAPEKLFGTEIKKEIDKEGLLDTSRNVLFLTEAVSDLSKGKNRRSKETIISSRISGDSEGFSYLTSLFSNLDFYENIMEFGRNIVSPIADNAFFYYKFRLEGTFSDENGELINKIKVIPRRKSDPVFNGYIFIVQDNWNIQGLDLFMTNENMNLPLIDSVSIRQDYRKLPGTKSEWAMNSQYSTFKVGILGFKALGFHSRNFLDYKLDQEFSDDYFGDVKIKVEKEANKRDSIYWEKVRPVPLGIKERKTYIRMDSMELVYSSKDYLDSVDRIGNKFKMMNLLTGFSHSNSFRKRYWSISGPLSLIGFNPVQGFFAGINSSIRKISSGGRSKQLKSELKYGFSDNQILGSIQFRRLSDIKNNLWYTFTAGRDYFQPSENQLVNDLLNAGFALSKGKSYIQLYEKKYCDFMISRDLITGMSSKLNLNYSNRSGLKNHTAYTFAKMSDYKPNIYEESGTLNYKNIFKLIIEVQYQPGVKIIDLPDEKVNISSEYPVFRLNYTKAVGFDNSFADYDLIKAGISGFFILGVFDNVIYDIECGSFLSKRKTDIIDDKFFIGSQFTYMTGTDFINAYHLMPFYSGSGFKPYLSISVDQNLKGIIFNRIPVLKKLKIDEFLTIKSLLNHGKLPYYELGAGLSVYKMISVRYSVGFQGSKYFDQGFRIGLISTQGISLSL